MIFRQLFDCVSSTYSYLLASRRGGEALIIDPVLEKVDRYLQLVNELDLRLVKAVDTHLHADHITGLGALRDRTHCIIGPLALFSFSKGNILRPEAYRLLPGVNSASPIFPFRCKRETLS